MKLPIQVEGIIYRRNIDNEIEFLLLKRIDSRGGFWQPLTGGVEDAEILKETLLRELKEETGITKYKQIISDVHMFKFPVISNETKKGITLKEYVFGIEVDFDVSIVLDDKEHCDFKWLNFEKALSYLKFDTNKEAFTKLYALIK